MPPLFPWAIFVLIVQKIGCRPIRSRSLLGIRRLYHANVKKSIVEAIKQSRALVKTFEKRNIMSRLNHTLIMIMMSMIQHSQGFIMT